MRIVDQYIHREILKFFTIVIITVVGIYISVDFFEKIDNFLERGVPVSRALVFFVLKTPFIIAQITPVAILLSVIIVLGLMNKNNEILALKSGGIGVWSIAKPVLLSGLLFTPLLFLLSETVVPVAMEKANRIWLFEVKREAAVTTRDKNIWIKGDDFIINIIHYDHIEKTAFGVTLHWFDENFRLVKRLDAKKARIKSGHWIFYDSMEQNFNESGRVLFHDEKRIKMSLKEDDLFRVVKRPEEMSVFELFSHMKSIEKKGYPTGTYRVDFYAKSAFPMVCIIMCAMGAGLSLRPGKVRGPAQAISLGIGIVFLYWVFLSLCISLGYGGVLPPVIAAWSPNIIFGCLGAVMLLNSA